MKVKLTWMADNQGRRETIIDADNVPGAEAQAKALYGSLPGYVCIGVNIITEPLPNQELPTHVEYTNQPSSIDTSSWELQDFAAWVGLMFSGLLIIFGLATFPFGIILIVLAVLMIRTINKANSGDWGK